MKKRARGRAYQCACGEEHLRLTRDGVQARVGTWGFLFGDCGGGVKLRFEGVRVAETRPVDKEEADRVRSLPVKRVDPIEAMVGELDDRQRRRLDEIVVDVREALEISATKWIFIGDCLAEAKRILRKGDFGAWVEHNGLDRAHAFKFIAVSEMVRALPDFHKQFVKIGQEKAVAIARLPQPKRIEILEDGVPIAGSPVPIEQVTVRQLNTFVRSVVGKDPRGRKPKRKDDARKLSERFGLPIECFESFQQAQVGLRDIAKFAKDGWSEKQRPAVAKLWRNVYQLFWKAQDDRGMGALLDG